MLNIIETSIDLINHDIENNVRKVRQKLVNKINHSKEGNKTNRNKKKKVKHISIIQINKGNSHLPKHIELIKKLVEEENAGVIIMPESQIRRD